MNQVGIIGCGCIFGTHASALEAIQEVRLAAVCDLQPGRLSAAADRYGAQPFSDYQEMIRSGKVDTVHLCTPHHLHERMAVYALEHGVDVLCEKPMSITMEEANRMRETARRTGRRLGIIFQNRFNPGALLVKEAMEIGKMGRLLGGKCQLNWHRDNAYYAQDRWRGRWDTEGGGVIINQAVHTLDLLRWLVGNSPVRVSAQIAHFGDTTVEVEDTAMGHIVFAGGATANFYFTNTNVRDTNVTLELFFEDGEAFLDGACGQYRVYSTGETVRADESSAPTGEEGSKPVYGNSHLRQIRAFYQDPEHAAWSLSEAYRTQMLLCALYQSAREHRPLEL